MKIEVGKIYENKYGDIRREVLGIENELVAYRSRTAHDTIVGVSAIPVFISAIGKEVNSLEFPTPPINIEFEAYLGMDNNHLDNLSTSLGQALGRFTSRLYPSKEDIGKFDQIKKFKVIMKEIKE